MKELRASTVPHTALATLLLLGPGAGAALGHGFSVGMLARGDRAEARLASAVHGFLVASAERDGHPQETSDGHIGGLDVDVVPLPEDAAAGITGLKGTRPARLDLLVILGPGATKPEPGRFTGFTSETIVLRPGRLPESWAEADGAESFATRFRAAFGAAPDRAAAEGYNAARRIDLAVRPLGGVSDRAQLVRSLGETDGGIDW